MSGGLASKIIYLVLSKVALIMSIFYGPPFEPSFRMMGSKKSGQKSIKTCSSIQAVTYSIYENMK